MGRSLIIQSVKKQAHRHYFLPKSAYLAFLGLKIFRGSVIIWGMNTETTWGERVRKAREARGLTQDAFAKQLGISRSSVQLAELAKTEQDVGLRVMRRVNEFLSPESLDQHSGKDLLMRIRANLKWLKEAGFDLNDVVTLINSLGPDVSCTIEMINAISEWRKPADKISVPTMEAIFVTTEKLVDAGPDLRPNSVNVASDVRTARLSRAKLLAGLLDVHVSIIEAKLAIRQSFEMNDEKANAVFARLIDAERKLGVEVSAIREEDVSEPVDDVGLPPRTIVETFYLIWVLKNKGIEISTEKSATVGGARETFLRATGNSLPSDGVRVSDRHLIGALHQVFAKVGFQRGDFPPHPWLSFLP